MLIVCAVTVVVQATAAQLFFNVGFSRYLRESESERLSNTAERIAAYYNSAGGWSLLTKDSDFSRHLIGDPLLSVDPRLPREPTRYALYNLDGKLLMGSPQKKLNAQSVPIVVGGVPVGMLVGTPLQYIRSAADKTFLDQQTTLGWLMVAVSLVLGAIASWLVAKLLLVPIKNLAAGTESIASGDYDVRVSVSSNDELGRLAVNFNSMANTLATNEQSRRQFMADISHELRTPLAILRGELEAVEDGLVQSSPTTIASLQHEVSTLTRLVDDIGQLAMADVGALTYAFEPVALVPFVAEIVMAWKDRLSRLGLDIGITALPNAQPIHVQMDAVRLTQVFHNLLENAGRYCPSGSRLDVVIELDGRFAQIKVIDYGPGVPEASLPRLFDRFFREDGSRSRATGGSGLGLAISRSIVEAHSGTISAMLSPTSGLTISIRLPIVGGFQ